MAIETANTENLTREEKYRSVIEQAQHLIEDEKDMIANLANISSLLKHTFEDYLWVGFYLTDSDNPEELVLGPFQGRPACTRIKFGNGVCGTSAKEKRTVIVQDVEKFPGHIVCDSNSKSEIVIPVVVNGRTLAVLDVDSDKLSNFGEPDSKYLEELISKLKHIFSK